MPLFDFHCQSCNITNEYIINSNDPNPTCPTCQTSMIKQMSAPAQFTGERIKLVNSKLDKIGAQKFKD